MKCNKCGSELKPDSKFCENCGAKAEKKKNKGLIIGLIVGGCVLLLMLLIFLLVFLFIINNGEEKVNINYKVIEKNYETAALDYIRENEYYNLDYAKDNYVVVKDLEDYYKDTDSERKTAALKCRGYVELSKSTGSSPNTKTYISCGRQFDADYETSGYNELHQYSSSINLNDSTSNNSENNSNNSSSDSNISNSNSNKSSLELAKEKFTKEYNDFYEYNNKVYAYMTYYDRQNSYGIYDITKDTVIEKDVNNIVQGLNNYYVTYSDDSVVKIINADSGNILKQINYTSPKDSQIQTITFKNKDNITIDGTNFNGIYLFLMKEYVKCDIYKVNVINNTVDLVKQNMDYCGY